MDSLKGMFWDHGRPVRQVAMQRLMGAKMAEGTHVREQIARMIFELINNEHRIHSHEEYKLILT